MGDSPLRGSASSEPPSAPLEPAQELFQDVIDELEDALEADKRAVVDAVKARDLPPGTCSACRAAARQVWTLLAGFDALCAW